MGLLCSHKEVLVGGASNKKKLSVGKAAVGGVLFGPLGALAGGAALGKTKSKQFFVCAKCGKTFTKKPFGSKIVY